MANRVIRDSIWTSPSLAKLSREAEAWFPRWLLMADDWGCFQADPRVVKGVAYPFREEVGLEEVDRLAVEYYNNGQLFLWVEKERVWGFFTAFHENNPYLQKLTVDEAGKPLKMRRKSPEPPKEALLVYLKERQPINSVFDIVRHCSTSFDKSRVSVSVSVSGTVSESGTKDFPAQKAKAGGETVDNLLKQPKPRSPNQRIQDAELESARKEFAKIFGGTITEAKVCRLAYGAGGDRRDCFETIPVLIAFWKSLKPAEVKDIENPYAYTLVCARDPETVERCKRQVFAEPTARRGGEIKTVGEVLSG